jgi:hypothetical protein
MRNLDKLTLEELIDILSTQTSLFLQLHEEGANKIEFEKCKQLIKAVQVEIKARKEIESK